MLPVRPSFEVRPVNLPEMADESASAEGAVTHHQQICPNCSTQLTGHHCKLVCTGCGYFMSCADYY